MKRRLMSLLQVKLLVDGYASLAGGALTQGYGTAKFTEAVYEAFLEVGVTQSPSCLASYTTDAGSAADIQGHF
jgi:hypothetical protein